MVDAFINQGFVGIYCRMLNGKQLVQLRGCVQSFLRVNVHTDLNMLAGIKII
jgi:hypothetical protein